MRLALTKLTLAISLSFPMLSHAQNSEMSSDMDMSGQSTLTSTAYSDLANVLAGINNPSSVPFAIPADTEALYSKNGYTGGEAADYPLVMTPATQAASRFLTQATFGPTAKSITYLADEIELKGEQQAYADWIERQINAPITNYHKRFIGAGACNGCNTRWWWDHTLAAPDQLRQRMGWALSQIIVVSIAGYNKDGPLAHYYQTLLNDSLGNFRTLLGKVSRHGAMATYLDNRGNFMQNAPNKHVNENYARELMQLFTLGTVMLNMDGTAQIDTEGNEIPAYTEKDVEQVALALTGLQGRKQSSKLRIHWRKHDRSAKTIFAGKAYEVNIPAGGSKGDLNFKMALDGIFNHPNTAPFISHQLIQHLVTSNPSPAYVERVATVFKDSQGDLGEVAKAILLDEEARTENNQTFGKLKSPVRQAASVMRSGEFKANIGKDMAGIHFPLAAPTVFSFYQPTDTPQGEIQDKNLVAPEFTLASTGKMTKLHNLFAKLLLQEGYSRRALKKGWVYRSKYNAAHELDLAVNNPEALIDRYNLLLVGGRMPAEMKTILVDYISSLPSNDKGVQRVKEARFLIATSSQQAVQQ